MGQKVNPHGLRVGVIKDWDSRWYARNDMVGDLIVEDYNIRKWLKSTLYAAGIAKIEIERDNAKVKIYIHCSRPGVVIGKGGAGIEVLKADLLKLTGKNVAVKVYTVAKEFAEHRYPDGTLLTDNKSYAKVAVKGGYVSLVDVQLAGKKRMPVADLLRGFSIQGMKIVK